MSERRPQVEEDGRSGADAGLKMAIHRIIEAARAIHGDLTAIADAGVSLSYRELNQRANAVAAISSANGFRRGATRLRASSKVAGDRRGPSRHPEAGGTYVLMDDEQEQCPRLAGRRVICPGD